MGRVEWQAAIDTSQRRAAERLAGKRVRWAAVKAVLVVLTVLVRLVLSITRRLHKQAAPPKESKQLAEI